MSAPPTVPERDLWLTIELRHLAALAMVARKSSFSGAADSLGYVQSAVSQQIGFLERAVGHRLVRRDGRPRSITLTDEGAALLDHIGPILEQLRLAKREIDAITRGPAPPPAVGLASIFGDWLAAGFLTAAALETGGEGWSRVQRGPSSRLLSAVEAGELDGAFVELPIATGPFFALELVREPCVLVVPATRASGDADAALHRWPLVAIDDCRVTTALREQRGDAEPRYSAESPEAALALVRAGVACAVTTSRDAPPEDGNLATLPLPDVPPRVLGLAWRRDRDDCPTVTGLRCTARRAF